MIFPAHSSSCDCSKIIDLICCMIAFIVSCCICYVESLYEGKLITCSVVAIVRRKPSRELLDRAQPIKNEMTGFWQCPFCLQDDFHDIGLVS